MEGKQTYAWHLYCWHGDRQPPGPRRRADPCRGLLWQRDLLARKTLYLTQNLTFLVYERDKVFIEHRKDWKNVRNGKNWL